VPWIIEASGFDYCMIDHEHGAFNIETIADFAGWFKSPTGLISIAIRPSSGMVWTRSSVR
jgi:2-keto-3-deoxy-L-rhamnonate aldolase RhmA